MKQGQNKRNGAYLESQAEPSRTCALAVVAAISTANRSRGLLELFFCLAVVSELYFCFSSSEFDANISERYSFIVADPYSLLSVSFVAFIFL